MTKFVRNSIAMSIDCLRSQFPGLSVQVYGRNVVYLDNAATSQRSQSVISKWVELSSSKNANLHRAVHKLANDATEEYEKARKSVAGYIGAQSPEDIVFTSGTTSSINLLAFSFGEKYVSTGDEIIVTEAEHHSNIVPWKLLCDRKNAVLKVLPVDECGNLRIDLLPSLITSRTRIVTVCQVSNVLGLRNPVEEIIRIAHDRNCPVLVDGAQGVVHENVDVSGMDCDFYAFSGHKIYAAPGTGVLYGKSRYLDALPPYMGGGEMIDSVSWKEITYARAPHRFEAGTQNMSGVPTFVPAFEIAREMNSGENKAYSDAVKDFIFDSLISRADVKLYGIPRKRSEKLPIFSFTVDGVHHEDIALLLDKMSVAVRSGQMCAEPLMDRFGVSGMLRASFAPYNSMQEAEYFVKSLDRAIKMLR